MSQQNNVEEVTKREFRYSFDQKCLDLAEHFLPAEATQSVKRELAQTIQDAVENFMGRSCQAL